MKEIERKFLIKTPPPGWRRQPHAKINQGYLAHTGQLEVRLRKKDDQYFLTIKSGAGLSRLEEEIELSAERFARLWPLTKGKRIAKTRYKIPFAGKTAEMDVYGGVHKGLITAEIEFKNMRELKGFQFPEWFDREVTGDPKYSNAALAATASDKVGA